MHEYVPIYSRRYILISTPKYRLILASPLTMIMAVVSQLFSTLIMLMLHEEVDWK